MGIDYTFRKKKKPLTRLEFEKEATKIMKGMTAKTKPFADVSPGGIKKRVDQAKMESFEGFEFFCLTYLPHYFTKPFGKIHRELIEYCLTKGKSINAIAYPREHGKSTIASFAIPLWKACCGMGHFAIITSDTSELTIGNLGRIRLECEENLRLRQDFGELKTPGEWTDTSLIIKNQYKIIGLGWREKIRGITYNQYRPDYVDGDDLENDENVRNKKLVQEKVDWLLGAVYGSIDDDGTLVVIGTMIEKDCALARLIKLIREKAAEVLEMFGLKCMNGAVYSAILDEDTPDERPVWPEGKSLKKLKQIKYIVGPKVWAAEYQNKPLDTGAYKLEWINYYNREILIGKAWQYFSGSDPSVTSDERNDFKAHVVIAFDPVAIKRYVVECYIKHAEMADFFNAFIELFQAYKMSKCGFETNGYQLYLKTELEKLCRDRDIWPNILELHHSTDKAARCSRWAGMVQRGDLLFANHTDSEILIKQMNHLGEKDHDDGVDALDMAIEVSQGGAGDFEFKSSGQKRASAASALRESFYQNQRPAAYVRGLL